MILSLIASANHEANDSGIFDTLFAVFGVSVLSAAGWVAKKVVTGVNDMHKVLVIMVGEKPDKFDQEPKKGMIETVADHSKQLNDQGSMLTTLMKASRANLVEGQNTGPETREAVRQIDEETRKQGVK